MTLLASDTLAQTQARGNLFANIAALIRTQSDIRPQIEETLLNVEWIFARDRTLTALDETGQWISGCSLPARTAETMLKKLDVRGAVAGFLSPTHAAQIEVALKSLRPEQAIIAIVPEMRDLAMVLNCHNFSQEITAHRLWFAAGLGWEAMLEKIFANHPGLATPTQFVRLPDAEATELEPLIAAAQKIFSQTGSARLSMLQSLRQQPIKIEVGTPKICVVAPSRFRLWNDVGDAMLRALGESDEIQTIAFDADDPANSSPIALLQAAQGCSAILTANTARTDLPGYLPDSIRWITWVTGPRIPSSAVAGIDDHLIIVDPEIRTAAIKASWYESRVHIGTWPRIQTDADPSVKSGLLIAADTASLDTPKDLIDYSSQIVLWETIRQELARDPLSLRDPNEFLTQRMSRSNIGEEAFSRSRFIEKLIIPAYQQGIARILLRAGLPLKIHGQGWTSLDEFKSSAKGPVSSRNHLRELISQAAAVVHLWPASAAHPIESFNTILLRPAPNRSAETLIRDARQALAGKLPHGSAAIPPISAELIRRLLQ